MKYRLECKCTDKQYYDFNKFYLDTSRESKKTELIAFLFVAVIAVIEFVKTVISEEDWFVISIVFVVLCALLVGWYYLSKLLSHLILQIYLHSMKKHNKMPFSESYIIEFYDEHLIETTDTTKEEVKYEAITQVKVNEGKAIYIFRNAIQAFLVPFDVFETEEERNEFIAFINEKVQK